MSFARRRVPADHAYVHVVRLFEAVVEIERAAVMGRTLAVTEDAFARAREVLAGVSSPQPGEARPLVDRVDDVSVAARFLRARLAKDRAVVAAPKEASTSRDEEAKTLSQRLDFRRLLSLLRARPGRIVSRAELAAHVWPDEALDEPAARARVDALVAARAEEDGAAGERLRTAGAGLVLSSRLAR